MRRLKGKRLTNRIEKVKRLKAAGLSNDQIAKKCNCSVWTVSNCLNNYESEGKTPSPKQTKNTIAPGAMMRMPGDFKAQVAREVAMIIADRICK